MTTPKALEQYLLAVHRLDPNLRVATALVLLEVARCHTKGTTVRALMERLEMAQPAVNRALQRLSSRGSQGSHSVGPALGLISIFQDPEESRRHLVTLSTEGLRFVWAAGLTQVGH